MQWFLKIISGMTNSVDPDQTAILLETLAYKICGYLTKCCGNHLKHLTCYIV